MFEKVKSVRIALCLVFISFLVFCGFVTARDEKYVTYFIHLYSAGLFRERNFTLHDAKATFGKDHIHRIEMSFACYKALPLERARELVTAVAMDFIEKVNNDPGLREKGLIKEKFIPRQLYLRILCDNVIGETYETVFIREIILDKGQLTYVTFKNMPEVWGKSYTIHEDFDYALMLTGNARHPEDVIAEQKIVPQLRNLRGDRNDFPHHREHEELLAPERPVNKAALEPRESAPSPILPVLVAVEEVSQLNLPPQEIPVIEEEVPLPVSDILSPEQGQGEVPTAPVVATGPALLPTAPPTPVPQENVQIEGPAVPTLPTAPVPTAAAAPAPIVPTASQEPVPQSIERLKSAEQEGIKLLSKSDTPDPDKEHVPTLPEVQIAESEEAPKEEQIDFFELFDSFSESLNDEQTKHQEIVEEVEESPEPSATIPGEALPEDNSSPSDENFEMQEFEFNAPPQAVAENEPEQPVTSQENREEQPASPSSDNLLVAEAEDQNEPPVEEETPQIEQEITPQEPAPVEDEQKQEVPQVQDDANAQVIAEAEEAPQTEEAPAKSWWERVFGSDKQEEQAQEEAAAQVQDEAKAEEIALAEEAPQTEEAPTKSFWERMFGSDKQEEQAQEEAPQVQDEAKAEEIALAEETPQTEEAPTKSFWEKLFGSDKQEEQAQEEAPQVQDEAKAEEIALAEETPQTEEAPTKSFWEKLFGSDKQEEQAQEEAAPQVQDEAKAEEIALAEEAAQTEEAPTKSFWERMFGSDKQEEQAQEEAAPQVQDEAKTEEIALAEEAPQTEEAPTKSWWEKMFGSDKQEEQLQEDASEVQDEVKPQDIADADEVPQADEQSDKQEAITPREEPQNSEKQVEESQPLTSGDDEVSAVEVTNEETKEEEPVKSWWQGIFSNEKQKQKTSQEMPSAALVLEDEVVPEQKEEPSAPVEKDVAVDTPREQVALVDDEVGYTQPQTEQVQSIEEDVPLINDEAIIEEEETYIEPEKTSNSWWQSSVSESKQVAPAEVAVESVTETVNETPLIDDEAIIEEEETYIEPEETSNSWWQSSVSESKQVAPAEVAVESATEPVEETPLIDDEAIIEEEETYIEPEEASSSWWQSSVSESEQAAPAEVAVERAAQPVEEVSFIQDEASVEEEKPSEPDAPAKSWWQGIFSNEKQNEQTEAPAEVVIIEDEQLEPASEEKSNEEPTESWWQGIFSNDKQNQPTADESPSDEEPSQEDAQVAEVESETQPATSWWKTVFAKEQQEEQSPQDNEETVPDASKEEPIELAAEPTKSWWQNIFTRDEQKEPEAVAQEEVQHVQEREDAPAETPSWFNSLFSSDDDSSKDDDEEHLQTVEAGPSASSAWWENLFSTDDEEEEENALQDERQEVERTVEENQHAVPSSESAESWWKKVFSSSKEEQAQDQETAMNEEPLIYDDEDQSLPNVSVEHVQIDTDEAIGKDEEAHDPVLKSLYREPLSWMKTRASQEPAGTFGDEQEEVIADQGEVEQ